MHTKNILCNYVFELFEDNNHNVNENNYRDFHKYTKAKGTFIISEKRDTRNMNKSSDTNK